MSVYADVCEHGIAPCHRCIHDQQPTLRDRFAMAALPGLLNNDGNAQEDIARWAYDMADSMLESRAPKQDTSTGSPSSPLDAAVKRLEAWEKGQPYRIAHIGTLGGKWRAALENREADLHCGAWEADLATAINAALDEAEKAGM